VELGLAGRVAIVTGASRGIGRQIASDLAAEGCDLVVCGRDEAALNAIAAAVVDSGRRAVTMVGDITEVATVARVVAAATDELGRLDILVNNAGGGEGKRLENVTDDDWRRSMDLNFFAAANLSVACLPAMRAAGWGRIVNIASTYAREPDPRYAPYGAAKAALLNLTKSLARGYAAEGVLTNCVIPGVTLTELVAANAAAAATAANITSQEVMDKTMANDPVAMGRFGEPDEVSRAVVFLASEAASWINGAALAVDGGTLRSI
jgi:3-oxoacyl-[acyl-carrier protein] reductase